MKANDFLSESKNRGGGGVAARFRCKFTFAGVLSLAAALLLGALPAAAQVPLPNNVEATTVPLAAPSGVAYDAAGNLYISAINDHVVRKVDLKGIITTVAGTGFQGFAGDGGLATAALLDSPAGLALDAAGNLYIADSHNHRIREVAAATGIITTIAGTGTPGFSGDGAAATSAQLFLPTAVSVDAANNIYIADTNNQRIRKITNGTITTVAGDGEQSYLGDGGQATATGLDTPNGVAADLLTIGKFYIGDTHNQRIRVVDVTGVITTLAGNGTRAFTGDGAAATASLNMPRGLKVDASGKVYIADADNNRIRTISGGTVTTIAGDGEQTFAGDTGAATSAAIDTPRTAAVSSQGVIALTDTHNQRVRVIGATSVPGAINTVAGISTPPAESLTLAGASSIVYGTGSLTATFANGTHTASGTVTLSEGATTVGSATFSGNTASLSVASLKVGLHVLAATFPGDATDAATASGLFYITVTPAPVIATANAVSILYGQPIPTLTGTITGVLPADTANVNVVFSTTAVQGSPVGVYPITATLTGSAASNYTVTLAPTSGSLTISAAGSNTSVTAAPNPAFLGTQVTITATVTSQTTGTPSGSVTFYDGAAMIGTNMLSAGVTSITTSTLALGTHSLTAVYTATPNFMTSTSAPYSEVIGIDPDFTLTATTPSASVPPGQAAVFGLLVTPQPTPFSTPITFTASGLPVGATATFSPTSVAPGSSPAPLTMTIQVPATHALLRGLAGTTVAAFLLLPFFGLRRRRGMKPFKPLTMIAFGLFSLAALAGVTGCGSGNGFFGQQQQTYTITVTATGTNLAGAVVQHSTTVQLTVQ